MIPEIAAGAVFLWCAVVIAADDYQFRIVPDRILVILFTDRRALRIAGQRYARGRLGG